jgi:hypothetical protein
LLITLRRSQAGTIPHRSKACQLPSTACRLLRAVSRSANHNLYPHEDDPRSTHVSSSPATTNSQLGCLVLECLTVTLPPEDMVNAFPLIHNGILGIRAGGVEPKPRASAWREVGARDLDGRARSGVDRRSISRELTWAEVAEGICTSLGYIQRHNVSTCVVVWTRQTTPDFRLWTIRIGDCRRQRAVSDGRWGKWGRCCQEQLTSCLHLLVARSSRLFAARVVLPSCKISHKVLVAADCSPR